MQQRKSHPDSFKKDAVRRVMARGSKTVAEVAKELGVSQSMLHRWRERFASELPSSAQVSQGEREEVERLRRVARSASGELAAKKSRGPLREGREVAVYELIHAERANITVNRACRVLQVARSGYYKWLHVEPSTRAIDDAMLAAEVKEVFRENRGRYGAPRIRRALRRRGPRPSKKRVARVMRALGLRGHTPRRFRKTTDSGTRSASRRIC